MASTAAYKSVPDGMDEAWYSERIEYLSGFMLPERFTKLREVLARRTRWMTLCMENTFHPQNASALIRNCEAFGIQDIYTVEELCRFKPNTNIVRGTDKWVDLMRYGTSLEAIGALRQKGYRIIATTPHRKGATPETFDVTAGPFALVFGTEHAGISEEVIRAADGFIKIPMCGFVESLNVSASAAILIQALSSRLRSSDVPWALTQQEQLPLMLRWMMRSVRDSGTILSRGFPEEPSLTK